MAVIEPTVDEFVERFSQFEGQEDKIELILPEARRYVSDRWIEEDTKMAIMYMTAHLLVTETAAEENSVSGGPVAAESFSIAGISESVSYAASAISGQLAEFQSTEYGRRYVTLFKRSFTGHGIIAV